MDFLLGWILPGSTDEEGAPFLWRTAFDEPFGAYF
jgi:hypothetical protein